LEPEEDKWLVSALLSNSHDDIEILIPLMSAGVIDVGKKGNHTDDLALTVGGIDFSVSELMDFRGDVCLIN
jgi:hypothetical protein